MGHNGQQKEKHNEQPAGALQVSAFRCLPILFPSVLLPFSPSQYNFAFSDLVLPHLPGCSVSGSWLHSRLHICVWLQLCFGTSWPPHLTHSFSVWPWVIFVCVLLHLYSQCSSTCPYADKIKLAPAAKLCGCVFVSTVNLSLVVMMLKKWKRWEMWQRLCSRRPNDNNSLCWPVSGLKSFSPSVIWMLYYPQQPFSGTMGAWPRLCR